MAIHRITYEFDQPPRKVYDTLCDLERHGEWSPIHAHWTQGPPKYREMAEGDEVRHRVIIAGIPAGLRWTITTHDRGKLFEARGTARFGVHLRLTARFRRRRPSGTVVEAEMEMDGGPLAGVAGAGFSRHVRIAQEHALARAVEMLR